MPPISSGVALAIIVIAVVLMIGPLRELFFKEGRSFMFVFSLFRRIWLAHVYVLKNLRPRSMVIPTLSERRPTDETQKT